MKKIAIGIDFSKETFDATIMLRDGDHYIELAYSKFDNDAKGFKAFEKWVRRTLKWQADVKDRCSWIFCGEHTGPCSLGLCDYLTAKGYFMWLEDARRIKVTKPLARQKNDRGDSRMIAEYALREFNSTVRPYKLDSLDLKQLRSLLTAHTILTQDKVAKINQLKSGALDNSPLAKEHIQRELDTIRASLKEVDKEINSLLRKSQEFQHHFEIANSFPGVGALTIAWLIVKTRNFQDMTDPRVLGCFIGVRPFGSQSGTSINKPPKTSRFRDPALNALLTTCATCAIMYKNPIVRPYYDRLVARGVHPNKAKNNCKYKIINVLMAMIRNNTKFSMEIHGKSKAQWKTAV